MSTSGKTKRKRAFMDITTDGKPLGRIVFELYNDKLPITCKNFLTLCTGLGGIGQKTDRPLTYKGSHIHRISAGFIIQGGDFSENNGTGGESIYGGVFDDEDFVFKHEPYTLSMANRGPNSNGSQFFITLDGIFPQLDNKHVAFGKVVSGFETVNAVSNLEVHSTKLRPVADVVIVNCGELRKRKAKEEDEQSEDEDKATIKTQKQEELKIKQNELDKRFYSTIKSSDLPQVPNTNTFLLRRSPQRDRNMRECIVGGKKPPNHHDERDGKRRDRNNRCFYRQNGRDEYRGYRRIYYYHDSSRRHRQMFLRIRGRGISRFHDRSRSWTPPHIRRETTRMITQSAAKHFLEKAYEGALKCKSKKPAEVIAEPAAISEEEKPVINVGVAADSLFHHRSVSRKHRVSDKDVPPDNAAKLIKQSVIKDEPFDSDESCGDRRPKIKIEVISPQRKTSHKHKRRSSKWSSRKRSYEKKRRE